MSPPECVAGLGLWVVVSGVLLSFPWDTWAQPPAAGGGEARGARGAGSLPRPAKLDHAVPEASSVILEDHGLLHIQVESVISSQN